MSLIRQLIVGYFLSMTILNYSSRSALVLTIAGLSIASTAGIASATSDTQIDKKCEQARMAIAEENKKN
ncbi:hypothetical protein [Arcanobacterium phocae]|uniref:hypothetical protein n=2 Tax=Arcanobacterium phocae TaxID=131112 RepID=UPI001C0EFD9F|nr:hypothetical protein [Arcanobacterium phocae]